MLPTQPFEHRRDDHSIDELAQMWAGEPWPRGDAQRSFTVGAYRDGNGNGVGIRDIAAGIDPVVEAPVRFADRFPRVALFVNDPDTISPDTTALVSFSPIGTATSITLYVRGPDGAQCAVRILGATGRTRVLRFVPGTRQWIEIL